MILVYFLFLGFYCGYVHSRKGNIAAQARAPSQVQTTPAESRPDTSRADNPRPDQQRADQTPADQTIPDHTSRRADPDQTRPDNPTRPAQSTPRPDQAMYPPCFLQPSQLAFTEPILYSPLPKEAKSSKPEQGQQPRATTYISLSLSLLHIWGKGGMLVRC